MSRVESLVYWFESHSMLSVLYMVDCESVSDYLMKLFWALAYPTFIVVCFVVWYSLLRWSLTCWCKQMRGTPVGNREVMVPLHSPRGLDFNFFMGFSLGLWPMYLFVLGFIYFLLNSLSSFLLGIMVCLGLWGVEF